MQSFRTLERLLSFASLDCALVEDLQKAQTALMTVNSLDVFQRLLMHKDDNVRVGFARVALRRRPCSPRSIANPGWYDSYAKKGLHILDRLETLAPDDLIMTLFCYCLNAYGQRMPNDCQLIRDFIKEFDDKFSEPQRDMLSSCDWFVQE